MVLTKQQGERTETDLKKCNGVEFDLENLQGLFMMP